MQAFITSVAPFLNKLLSDALAQRSQSWVIDGVFDEFNEIYIQDAAHFSLPRPLSDSFPGSHRRHGSSAQAKVQAVYYLRRGCFDSFSSGSFRDNDQKDAPRIQPILNEGDLVIRDLGYHTFKGFEAILSKDAHFLSRYRYGTVVTDSENGKRIDLLKHLKKHGQIDMVVSLGRSQELDCCLVAVPPDEQTAIERIRKAKNDRHSKVNLMMSIMPCSGIVSLSLRCRSKYGPQLM